MKYFVDGDHLCITRDDFVNLQESPVVFYRLDCSIARTILRGGSVTSLPIGDLIMVRSELLRAVSEKAKGE